MVESLRLFISLPIPADVRAQIEAGQGELRKAFPDKAAKWTKPGQFHLTLRFLGEVDEARVPELLAALREACRRFAPMALIAERMGVFPHLRFPRVVWAWVHDKRDDVVAMQAAIEKAVAPFSSKPSDKKFTGHVTLARLDGMKHRQAERLKTILHEMESRRFGEWTAREVTLMKSELLPTGATHTVLAAIPLGEAPPARRL